MDENNKKKEENNPPQSGLPTEIFPQQKKEEGSVEKTSLEPQTITPHKEGAQQKEKTPSDKEVVEKAPSPKKEASWIAPLRTFKNDVSRNVKERGTSLSGMIIAEKEKREREGEKEASFEKTYSLSPKGIVLILVSVVLIIGGAIFIIFSLGEKESTTPAVPATASKDIIFIETAKKIPLELDTRAELLQKVTHEIQTRDLLINTVQHTYLVRRERVYTEGDVVGKMQEVRLSFPELITLLRSNAPSELIRAVDPNFVFGIHTFTDNNPFLLLHVNSFPNAFSGMFLWENTLMQDIAPFFGINQERGRIITESFFKDVVIENTDARILEDTTGELVLLYAFLGKNILLITTHEVTLDEIKERLERGDPIAN